MTNRDEKNLILVKEFLENGVEYRIIKGTVLHVKV